jgi:hypothetical protein
MSIGSSVGGKDQYDRSESKESLYLANIQREKQHDEKNFTNPQSNLFKLVAATLYLKKFVDQFVGTIKSSVGAINTEKCRFELKEFKYLLEELIEEDKSHVPEFTQRLSIHWQKMSESCNAVAEKSQPSDPFVSQILSFIGEIKNFPPGEDHTLGYYLDEHAGQEWIPFPFMNLLRALREEHLTAPQESQIYSWIQQLNALVS